MHEWQGRPIISKAHIPDLESRAAVLEFEEGLSRDMAEDQAHEEYAREHHKAAAAHHLKGLQDARDSGDLDEARKHGEAYARHINALGYDDFDPVPDEIRELAQKETKKKHNFKEHHGDSLLSKEQ